MSINSKLFVQRLPLIHSGNESTPISVSTKRIINNNDYAWLLILKHSRNYRYIENEGQWIESINLQNCKLQTYLFWGGWGFKTHMRWSTAPNEQTQCNVLNHADAHRDVDVFTLKKYFQIGTFNNYHIVNYSSSVALSILLEVRRSIFVWSRIDINECIHNIRNQ